MLARITIDNFRSHKHTVLEFDQQILYVGGLNGTGKSSLGLAFQILFTDRCPVTDKRGAGKINLVRQGEADYMLVGELDNGGKISKRTSTAAGLGVGKLTALNAKIEQELASSSVLSTVLGGSFFELDEQEQRSLLITMSGAEMSSEAFGKFVNAGFQRMIASPDRCDPKTGFVYNGDPLVGLSLTAKELPMIDASTVAGLDAAKKMYEGFRRDANREVKQRGIELDTLTEDWMVEFDREQIGGVGSNLKSQLDVQQRALDAIPTPNVGVAQEVIKEQQAGFEQELAVLNPPKNVKQAITRAGTSVGKASESVREEGERAATLMGQVNVAKQTLEKYQSLTDKCATCGSTIDKTKRLELIEGEEKKVSELTNKIKVAQENKRKAEDTLGLAQNRQKELNRIVELQADIDTRATTIATIADVVVEDTTDQRAAEVAKVEAAKAKYNEWFTSEHPKLAKIDHYIEVGKLLAKYRDDAAAYDFTLVLINDYRKEAVDATLGLFMAGINKHAEQFDMAFTVDSSTMLVTTSTGLFYKQLSESEQVRTDTVFRLALALNTGVRLIVVDRVDVLDTKNRIALLKLLLKAGIKALLLVKLDDGELKPPALPKVKWLTIELENGASKLTEVIPAG